MEGAKVEKLEEENERLRYRIRILEQAVREAEQSE